MESNKTYGVGVTYPTTRITIKWKDIPSPDVEQFPRIPPRWQISAIFVKYTNP